MDITALPALITTLHRDTIVEWIQTGIVVRFDGILQLVAENHAFNFQLWHAEDRARRDDKGHSFVYHAKRDIDRYNQQRNDRMEGIDQWLAEHMTLPKPNICPAHSETPGMMIDRLSILALKAYHMGQQSQRANADGVHRQMCAEKLAVLHQQQNHLSSCLKQLLADIQQQLRTFHRYHQFKMYNDPSLNPQLYQPQD